MRAARLRNRSQASFTLKGVNVTGLTPSRSRSFVPGDRRAAPRVT